MITPESSPLAEPVRIALPPVGVSDDIGVELMAWLRAHQVDPPRMQLDLAHGIVVDRGHINVRSLRPLGLRGFTAVPTTWPDLDDVWTRPLQSHPGLRMLVVLAKTGNLTCTATYRHVDATTEGAEQTRALWECNVLVDSDGRHRGPHADGRHGDEAGWPNTSESLNDRFDLSHLLTGAGMNGGFNCYVDAQAEAKPFTRADLEAAMARLREHTEPVSVADEDFAMVRWRHDGPPEPIPPTTPPRYVIFHRGPLQIGTPVDVYKYDKQAGSYRKMTGDSHVIDC